MTDFTIIDEFAEMPPEIGDEWVDRHGVDRSPDAEAQRIDDAYEKYRDYDANEEAKLNGDVLLKAIDAERLKIAQQAEADKWAQEMLNPGERGVASCKWCQLPNGKHHPNCSAGCDERRVTAAEILRVKLAGETAAQRLARDAMEYSAESLRAGAGHGAIWKIAASTQVFVADNKGVLHGHRMKKDAAYDECSIANPKNGEMKFIYPLTGMGNHIITSLAKLTDQGWAVIETGVKAWPYIMLEQKYAIVVLGSLEGIVGKSGGTCRKLGY